MAAVLGPLLGVFVAAPCRAAPTTENYGLGTMSDLAANDGVVCGTHANIGGDYPDDGVWCRNKDKDIVSGLSFMTSLDILAVGDGGRVWGVRDDEVVLEVNGAAHVLTTLPEPGRARDFVLFGNTNLVPVAGLDLALDTPLVLMQTGHAYYFVYDNDPWQTPGWNLVPEPNGAWAALSSVYAPSFGFALPSLVNYEAELWEATVGLSFTAELPALPATGTGFGGIERFAVAGRTMVENGNYNIFHELELDSSFDLVWKPLPCWKASCSFQAVTNGPTEYLAFDVVADYEQMCDAGPGCGIARLVGGAFGFDYYNAPGQKVHGFFVSSFGRGYAIIAEPPVQTLSAEWQNSDRQLPFWPSDPSPQLVEVDDLGGPVFELPAGWAELPALPIATYKLPRPRENIALDVYVPSGQSAWAGAIELSGEVPAAGVWDTYLAYRSLDGLPRDTWVKVEFPIPAGLKSALDGDYPNARLRATSSTELSGVRVRGLRFSGTAPTAARPPHQALRSDVRSNAFLDFETDGDWSGLNTETSLMASHGLRSMRLSTDGWTEVETRVFATSELPAVGQALSLDVFVPQALPQPSWIGNVSAYLQCPSKGVWGRWLGQAELGKLFPGEWNTVRIPLGSSTITTLQSGASDCSLRVTVSSEQTDLAAAFMIDHVGFLD
jgi:hypothetical protein